MLRKLLVMTAIVSMLFFGAIGIAFADDPHQPGATGQPGKTCGTTGAEISPGGGNSVNSTGSPFTGGTADSHYNVANSQYDVACFQNSPPQHP